MATLTPRTRVTPSSFAGMGAYRQKRCWSPWSAQSRPEGHSRHHRELWVEQAGGWHVGRVSGTPSAGHVASRRLGPVPSPSLARTRVFKTGRFWPAGGDYALPST